MDAKNRLVNFVLLISDRRPDLSADQQLVRVVGVVMLLPRGGHAWGGGGRCWRRDDAPSKC